MTLMDARVDKVYKVVATNGEKNEKRRLLDMGFMQKNYLKNRRKINS